jgi:hypothetical protein
MNNTPEFFRAPPLLTKEQVERAMELATEWVLAEHAFHTSREPAKQIIGNAKQAQTAFRSYLESLKASSSAPAMNAQPVAQHAMREQLERLTRAAASWMSATSGTEAYHVLQAEIANARAALAASPQAAALPAVTLLTDERIETLWAATVVHGPNTQIGPSLPVVFARAIEAEVNRGRTIPAGVRETQGVSPAMSQEGSGGPKR